MKVPLARFALFLLLVFSGLVSATGQVPDQLKVTIPAVSGGIQSGAELGRSVAVDGSYVVVGAPDDDTGASGSGVVKVFDSTTGALLFVLLNPNPASEARFGNSVAISGTRVVVGYPNQYPGKVHVFDLSSPTPTEPATTLTNPNPQENQFFGVSVAISGTRIAVAARPLTNGPGAYVYDLSGLSPAVPVVVMNNPTTGNEFGNAVAISGTRVVVGAYRGDIGALDTGNAYVYDISSASPASPVATLRNPTPAPGEEFGFSVAISGTRVVVGATRANAAGTDPGEAYVFDLSSGAPTTPILTLNNPSPAAQDRFGQSVAISGTRVIVGADQDDPGASVGGRAYVYDLGSGTPTIPVATLSPPTGECFGYAVAISGARLVVGDPCGETGARLTGNAYVYDLSSATPTVPIVVQNDPGPLVYSGFAASLAISGTTVVVGATGEPGASPTVGKVHIYDLNNEMPTAPYLTLNDPLGDIGFGYPVAISGTGVVIGAPYNGGSNGGVYVYDLGGGTPTVPVARLNNPNPTPPHPYLPPAIDYFGYSLAIDGARLAVGAFGQNKAYIYDLSNGTPMVTLNNPTPTSNSYFGRSVAISGTRVVVGAYNDNTGASQTGRAYVYNVSSATPIATLDNPSPAANDHFGAWVAISGTRVVIGEDTGMYSSAGNAYIYDLSGVSPTVPIATLNNPAPAVGDRFGGRVSISGSRVVVGSLGDDTDGTDAGSVYVYDLGSPTPAVPVVRLHKPNPPFGDGFGSALAIDGSTIATGSSGIDTGQVAKGAAFIFGPSPYSLWKVSQLNDQFATDLGDGDGDGLDNLGEYGLLRSPTTPEGESFSAASALYPEGERLRLFVPRDPARNDITLEVQAGGRAAGPWATIATSVLGAPFTGPGYFGGDSAAPGVKSVEIRDVVNVTDAPQRFLRVRVQH